MNISNAANNQYIQWLLDAKNIEVKTSEKRETDYPSWAQPDLDLQHTDLSYRVQDILPYEQDKDADAYIVYPSQGIIYPVLSLFQEDKDLIMDKKKFDHYKYLQNGWLQYIWERPSMKSDNMVIAIHSAYFKKDLWRYKTAGQATILANWGDKIRYFEKENDGTYTRYEYNIIESKETNSKDTSILFPESGKTQLTIYTCSPIGSTRSRYYNKADLISKVEWFTNISSKTHSAAEQTPIQDSTHQNHNEEAIVPSSSGATWSEQQFSYEGANDKEDLVHFTSQMARTETISFISLEPIQKTIYIIQTLETEKTQTIEEAFASIAAKLAKSALNNVQLYTYNS